MKGMTYFTKTGFSINEGAGPANIHISWLWPSHLFFFYIFIWRFRFHFMIDRRRPKTEAEIVKSFKNFN